MIEQQKNYKSVLLLNLRVKIKAHPTEVISQNLNISKRSFVFK